VKGIKLLSKTLFISLVALVFVSSIQAMSILPPDEIANPAALFGQDHSYTVTFRGNGEAVVNLRVLFTNTDEGNNLSQLSYRVPGVDPQDIVAYQVIREPNCIRYAETKTFDISDSRDYIAPNCIEYDEPDYSNVYWYGKTSYKKAIVAFDVDTITITVPKQIEQGKSGSLLLYYRSQGYTKKGAFDTYEYKFESLKTEDPIKNLQIGVTTDSDLKLKNADAAVQYRNDGEFASMQGMMADSKVGVSNAQFDQYYQQIGSGQIIESATYLQPLDSFTMEGAYADSSWKLNGKNILIGTVVIVVLIIIFGYVIYRLVKYLKKRHTDRHSPPSDKNMGSPSQRVVPGMTFLWMVVGSFISSILAAGYTIFIFMFGTYLNSWYYSEFNMLIMLFLIIVSFGIYPLFIFGSAIFIGIKRGLWWGVGTFALTLMWLVIYLFVLFGFMMLSRSSQSYPRPVPYMMGTQDSGVYMEKSAE